MNWYSLSRAMLALVAASAFAQGLGSGTSVVVLRSADVLVAAVDSKENDLLYRDGISTASSRNVCKVARPGPFYAMVAGIANGTNGFDALRETESSWQSGDGLDALAARVREAVPRKLLPLMQSLRDVDAPGFETRYRGRTALQLLLMGAERGVPQIRILEFLENGAAGSVGLSVRMSACPGDCSGRPTAWFLGTHESIDEFVRDHAGSVAHPDERSLDRLIGLEYRDRPDIVGGPVSMIRIDRAGGTVLRGGACL